MYDENYWVTNFTSDLALDLHAHNMHMGIMWEERHRCRESKLSLFTNRYPLVEMGWTHPMCYAYNQEV